ncbi:hypothetical protein BDR26DRAFT_918503 [Obelidium mucronatum]|nr:hypothetical protein BDR26DRAFT_918503 [Obelidium mucronatum]
MLAISALSVIQKETPSIATALRLYAVQIQKYCVEKHPGLSLFCPSETELTLCGTAFVVDIHLDATKNGSIRKVKLSYVENGDQVNDRDGGVYLKKQLEDSFSLFAASIDTLALCDKHTSPELDAFKLYKLVKGDMEKVHQREVSYASASLAPAAAARDEGVGNESWALSSGMHPMVSVLLDGHGIYRVNPGKLGVGLVYWVGRGDVLGGGVDDGEGWDNVASPDSKLLDSFEEVYSTHISFMEGGGQGLNMLNSTQEYGYFGPPDTNSTEIESTVVSLNGLELKFRKSTTLSSLSLNKTCFMLELNPPVPCSMDCKSKLLSASSSSSVSSKIESSAIIPLLDAIHAIQNKSSALTKVKGGKLHHSPTTYSKVKFAMPNAVASSFMVDKVPFTHPDEIYTILQSLRRQIVFNTLVGSLIPVEVGHVVGKARLVNVIQVVGWNPPDSITVSVLVLERNSVVVVLKVDLDERNTPVVMMQGEGNRERLEKVLQATLDFGVALEFL